MKNLLKLWKKYSFLLLIAFIAGGLFDLRFAIAAVICMVAPVIVSIFKGRFWCGNLCPRGSFYDNIISKISNRKKAPAFLRSKLFRGIMVAFLMSMFTIGLISNWGDLYGIGMVFYRIIVVTTIIGVILSFRYNHRTWCHFCPMGTFATLISHYKKSKRVLHVSRSCVSCNICSKKCAFNIAPKEYKDNILSDANCIQCGKCVTSCPKNAIGYKKVS